MQPSDELWDKAVQIAGVNRALYPGTMVEHERVHDLQGRLEEYTRSEYRLRFDLRPDTECPEDLNAAGRERYRTRV